ncbi:MAG: IPT/TIG domain-containing protein [Thermoleophilia bacterium]|jgi:LPXTG-motif cell wall-anchored protein
MKIRLFIALFTGLVLALGLAGVAQAQSRCDSIAVSTTTGQAGDTVTASGYAFEGDTVTVTFDGDVVKTAVGDVYDDFSASFTVPTGAAAGAHTIRVTETGEIGADCSYPFAVAAAALAPAATVPVTVLPNTGFLFAPAGLLIGSGLGALLYRKRRR